MRFTPILTLGAIENLPFPSRNQQAGGFSGRVLSIKQPLCWGSPTFRQQSCCCRSFIAIQVGEYLLNNRWVFDAGDDLDITTALSAGFNINVKHALQALCPGHCCVAFGRSLVLLVACRLGLFASASFSGRHHCPIATIGCKHSMEAG